jgi:hypothetical protein
LTFLVLAVVIVGGGLLALDATGSDETALYGFVGIALGAFAGLLVPSPVATSGCAFWLCGREKEDASSL